MQQQQQQNDRDTDVAKGGQASLLTLQPGPLGQPAADPADDAVVCPSAAAAAMSPSMALPGSTAASLSSTTLLPQLQPGAFDALDPAAAADQPPTASHIQMDDTVERLLRQGLPPAVLPLLEVAPRQLVDGWFRANRPADRPTRRPSWHSLRDVQPGQESAQLFVGQLPTFAPDDWVTACLEHAIGIPGSVLYSVARRERGGRHSGYSIATLASPAVVEAAVRRSQSIYVGRTRLFMLRAGATEADVEAFRQAVATHVASDSALRDAGYARATLVLSTANAPNPRRRRGGGSDVRRLDEAALSRSSAATAYAAASSPLTIGGGGSASATNLTTPLQSLLPLPRVESSPGAAAAFSIMQQQHYAAAAAAAGLHPHPHGGGQGYYSESATPLAYDVNASRSLATLSASPFSLMYLTPAQSFAAMEALAAQQQQQHQQQQQQQNSVGRPLSAGPSSSSPQVASGGGGGGAEMGALGHSSTTMMPLPPAHSSTSFSPSTAGSPLGGTSTGTIRTRGSSNGTVAPPGRQGHASNSASTAASPLGASSAAAAGPSPPAPGPSSPAPLSMAAAAAAAYAHHHQHQQHHHHMLSPPTAFLAAAPVSSPFLSAAPPPMLATTNAGAATPFLSYTAPPTLSLHGAGMANAGSPALIFSTHASGSFTGGAPTTPSMHAAAVPMPPTPFGGPSPLHQQQNPPPASMMIGGVGSNSSSSNRQQASRPTAVGGNSAAGAMNPSPTAAAVVRVGAWGPSGAALSPNAGPGSGSITYGGDRTGAPETPSPTTL